MAVNSPHSPRQKMINVMYLVFIAMLAMNVSVDVLDGFKQVDDQLGQSTTTLVERNRLIMDELTAYYRQNPQKAGQGYQHGLLIQSASDSLSRYIQELKIKMVHEADGKRGDLNNIRRKDDLEAASVVLLSPLNGEGKNLQKALEIYRETLTHLVTDQARIAIIERNLNTTPHTPGKSWEASLFEQMPLAAAITLLTKIDNDVRSSEGEALTNILYNIDGSDVRMNRLKAFLIPESDIVIQGGTYSARAIIAAEDTTRSQTIYIDGQPLKTHADGQFSLPANQAGTYSIQGHIEVASPGGSTHHPFQSSYTVIPPMASIAPQLTNVLYAGIDNEISISVPGMAPAQVQATIDNGTLRRTGNTWSVRPLEIGQNATITVSTQTSNGSVRRISEQSFRVRALPDPTPYIPYTDTNGHTAMFKGGNISKGILLNSQGIQAAIDDGILSVPFQVNSFRTVFFDSMGNAIPEVSNGNQFSDRQKEQIRRLPRGAYFYISGVRTTGPDGTEREIAVLEVRVQ